MEHHYFFMIVIMIVSGLLSSMYIWSDKLSDIRLSLNDLYMIILMTAWMCFFMGINDYKPSIIITSLSVVLLTLVCIRKQTFIGITQYYTGMIPHHSMALLMSKKLLDKTPRLNLEDRKFIENIITTQEAEIAWMKNKINDSL